MEGVAAAEGAGVRAHAVLLGRRLLLVLAGRLAHEGLPDLGGALLLGGGAGEGGGLGLGLEALLLLAVLAAEEGEGADADGDEGGEDDGDDDAGDVEVVLEVHADVPAVRIHGAGLARLALLTRGGGVVAVCGLELAVGGDGVAVGRREGLQVDALAFLLLGLAGEEELRGLWCLAEAAAEVGAGDHAVAAGEDGPGF